MSGGAWCADDEAVKAEVGKVGAAKAETAELATRYGTGRAEDEAVKVVLQFSIKQQKTLYYQILNITMAPR